MYYWGKPAPLYSYNVLLVCEAGEPWEYYKNVIVFVSSGDGQELLDLIANSSVFQCSHRSLKLEGIDSRCNLYSEHYINIVIEYGHFRLKITGISRLTLSQWQSIACIELYYSQLCSKS